MKRKTMRDTAALIALLLCTLGAATVTKLVTITGTANEVEVTSNGGAYTAGLPDAVVIQESLSGAAGRSFAVRVDPDEGLLFTDLDGTPLATVGAMGGVPYLLAGDLFSAASVPADVTLYTDTANHETWSFRTFGVATDFGGDIVLRSTQTQTEIANALKVYNGYVSGLPTITLNGTTGDIQASTLRSSTYRVVAETASGSSGQIAQYAATGQLKWISPSGDATIADGGAVTVVDDSHAHTGATLGNIDISDDTNLAGVANETELVGDAIGLVTTPILDNPALATTATPTLTLRNATAATSGAKQQYSPAFNLSAQGWDAGAANRQYEWLTYIVPTVDTSHSTMYWSTRQNGGSLTNRMNLAEDSVLGGLTRISVSGSASSGTITMTHTGSTDTDGAINVSRSNTATSVKALTKWFVLDSDTAGANGLGGAIDMYVEDASSNNDPAGRIAMLNTNATHGASQATAVRTYAASNSLLESYYVGVNPGGTLSHSGNAPTISSCGTGPTAATGSGNTGGLITVGTGVTTACTLTWNPARATEAACVVTPYSNVTAYISASSATAITVTFSADMAAAKWAYQCVTLE